jgi:nitrite reductase/ring-hydroxylating ferredoxin subunit
MPDPNAPSPPAFALRRHQSAPIQPAVALCASHQLEERGKACVFDVLHFGEPAHGFALRFEGQVVAYLNRCVHVPTEMDWQHGEFLDGDRAFILCSIHGAAYEPQTGHCVAGPCGRGRLTPLSVHERDGQVWWQPAGDTLAPPAGASASASPV